VVASSSTTGNHQQQNNTGEQNNDFEAGSNVSFHALEGYGCFYSGYIRHLPKLHLGIA
jgi:hypothetical protein